jgi:hypothetical protein
MQVSQHKRELEQVVRSVRFTDKGEITFDLPQGWGRNDKQPEGEFKRYATLELGTKERPLECLVHQLPAIKENVTGNVVANLNRWRGQIGLYGFPEDSGDWRDFVREDKVASHTVHIIDMVGPGLSPAAAVAQRQQPRLPADHPPLKKRPAEVEYEAPKEWRERPPVQFSMAAWEVGQGDKAATITISEIGGGLVANVNRWRGQLGLPQLDEAALLRETRDVPVGNRTGKMVELVNPNAKGDYAAIIGVIAPGERQDLIVLIRGPHAETVLAQRANLEAFLRTVKFAE